VSINRFLNFICKRWNEFLVGGLLVFGLGLTVLSHLKLCSSACTAAHDYRLYTLSFETVGLMFFSTAILTLLASFRWPQLRLVLKLLVASAVGSEIYFIIFQKIVIGSWCPVCLTIAAVVLFTFFILLFRQKNRARVRRIHTLMCVPLVFFGFIISFTAVVKKSSPYRVELSNQVILGNAESAVEVYIFSDWMCSSCRLAESEVEGGVEKVFLSTKVCFVDLAVNKESMNYLPYNLTFMVNNKDKYLDLRKALGVLAEKGIKPTPENIREVAKVLKVNYEEPLGYLQVNEGRKHFKAIAKEFHVTQTPTVIIRNADTKEEKRLVGYEEITQVKITSLVSALS